MKHAYRTSPLQVSDSWLIRIGSWLALLLGLYAFSVIFFDQGVRREKDPYHLGLIITSLGGFFLLGIGLLGALTTGTTVMDREKIIRRTLLKRTQMRWDEITHIEEGAGECVIYGHHGRLLLYSPGWWSGKAEWKAELFLQEQIKLRGIKIKPMRSLFSSRKKDKID
jgi:hypothetical protein